MEHCLHFTLGWLVWQEDHDWVDLEFSCRNEKRGLYKAWIAGGGPAFFIGTLLPEGGALRLRRRLHKKTLQAQRCWPIRRAGAVMAYRFQAEDGPQWQAFSPESHLAGDPRFVSLGEMQGCLFREEPDAGQWQLAVPFAENEPFPLTALFCFCTVEHIGGALFAVCTFDETGSPKVPVS